jgi:hypothetical protein
MSRTFTLVDRLALSDLHVFLGRAQRVDDGSVRLIAESGVLAVYVSVLHPAGLLDESPTVLGLRTFALANRDLFDVVVPVRSLLARVEGLLESAAARPTWNVTVTVPMQVNTVTWAAISPPRSGWRVLPRTQTSVLDASARAGIAEVAAALPTGTGEQIVHRVRTEIWGRSIDGLENVPAGAAFAAFSLGFLGDSKRAIVDTLPKFDDMVAGNATAASSAPTVADTDAVSVYESGVWTRLTTPRGHVLIKRRAWAIAR